MFGAQRGPMSRRHLLAAALMAALPFVGAAPARAEEEKKKGGGVHYIQLQALTATIFRADRRRGVLTVEVGLDIPDNGLRGRASQSLPRLRAAYVEFLMGYAVRLPPATVPDADYLASQLQRITDQTLGQGGARLLLGTILVN
jgi:hypothetical protein